MVELKNAHKIFNNNVHALRGVDFEVQEGEVVALIGPSGSGKSTLLRCINQLERLDDGKLSLWGKAFGPRETIPKNLRQNMGMIFQHFNLFPHLSVKQNITVPLRAVKRIQKIESDEIAEEMLKKVGLFDKTNSFPHQLSGGQKQRVAIARSLAMSPRLMLCDEPTSALDPELVQEVVQVLRRLADEGMTMILVTHELGLARNRAQRVVFMEAGKIIEEGTPERLFNSPLHERTKGFISQVLR
ncbi:MAG: peptide ABC transporter ATP-binding protein [Deltaproteobacteria bacterium RIFCSPHIGHO2_12_FULL_43_9]|nr:MAG: peptide ABC transporter ATP-binding protein [Deltaproteobacteria bacterium RIFCSPHIGHO2_12_FULL_43_9]